MDNTAAYYVRITLTTPSMTSADKKAGKSTTHTEVLLEVHPEWAPFGAARFRMLVENQFFVGSSFHCAIPGFILQFGLHADPQTGYQWRMPIADEDEAVLRQSNTEGTVAFVSTGPNTRCCALVVNMCDNSKPGASPLSFATQHVFMTAMCCKQVPTCETLSMSKALCHLGALLGVQHILLQL